MSSMNITRIPPAQKYALMIEDLFKEMGSPQATRIHAGLGISGEAAELLMADMRNDPVNILEESGDSFFYVQKLFNMHGWTLDSVLEMRAPIDPGFSYAVGMSYEAGNLLDALKKSWVYEKALDEEEVKLCLCRYLRYFGYMLLKYNFSFDEVMAANQWKLVTGPKARYPSGKYTNQAAIDRADKAV